MAKRIVVGYDDKEPAKRALERAIEEAKARKAEVVVVSVVEMPLNPEGPQNFGSLDDTPARMIPLVLPPEPRARDRPRARADRGGRGAERLLLGGGRPGVDDRGRGRASRTRRSSCSARTTTACSAGCSAPTSRPRSSAGSAPTSSSSTDASRRGRRARSAPASPPPLEPPAGAPRSRGMPAAGRFKRRRR